MKRCDGCTFCCFAMAVRSRRKGSFTRCTLADNSGCKRYGSRPRECRAFRCVWMESNDWPEQLRPDRCGVMFSEQWVWNELDPMKRRIMVVCAFARSKAAFEEPAVARIILDIASVRPVELLTPGGYCEVRGPADQAEALRDLFISIGEVAPAAAPL